MIETTLMPASPKRRRKRGRPRIEPTDQQREEVKGLAGLRFSDNDIATYIGLHDVRSLRKHFKQELKMGVIEANGAVMKSLFEKATGDGPGAVGAATTLAQAWLGLKPAPVEIVGKNGGPIEQDHIIKVVFVKPPVWPEDPTLDEDRPKA